MNIDKLREAWQLGNPKVFRFKSIFGFIQFCWENKFTPYNSATVYDEKEESMDIKRTGKETGERYVNINTISHLIYNGVKYVVE